jgi:hypothetical protein
VEPVPVVDPAPVVEAVPAVEPAPEAEPVPLLCDVPLELYDEPPIELVPEPVLLAEPLPSPAPPPVLPYVVPAEPVLFGPLEDCDGVLDMLLPLLPLLWELVVSLEDDFFLCMSPMARAEELASATNDVRMNAGASLRIVISLRVREVGQE